MPKLTITLRDNDDKEFRKDIEIEVNEGDYLILKDRTRVYDWEIYNKVWDKLCDRISAQYELPIDWYIDRINY